MEANNVSHKKIIHESKELENLHPPNDTMHAEILDLKSKQEEIQSQQATFKQETETHINSWAQVVRAKDKTPTPHAAVEEVVEECTRRARELNLKVRGLPLPHSSPNPMEVGARFPQDTLSFLDIALDKAWLGYNSTLFLRIQTASDRLCVRRAKRKLFSLPNGIFLDQDLTRAQVMELKQSKEQVMAAQQERKWAIIKNLQAVI